MPTLYGEISEVRQQVTGWVCNKCARDIDVDEMTESQEVFRYRDIGGYGSVWGDGTDYEIVLCQRCAYGLLAPYATVRDGESEVPLLSAPEARAEGQSSTERDADHSEGTS